MPTTSRARCRRSPTAAPPTCARWPTSSRRCASTAGRAAATPISALAALLAADGRLAQAVRLLLRAAPAPRARLRRAQGDSRNPRGRRRADAHRDLAPAAAHARLDEGLSVVARGRGSRHVPAEALHASPIRCCASGCACTAARPRRPKTTSRAKCTATRCRGCRGAPKSEPPKPATPGRARVRDGRRTAVGDHRDRLTRRSDDRVIGDRLS